MKHTNGVQTVEVEADLESDESEEADKEETVDQS